jgi:UDP-N-acetylglucosamine 2-epimerase (non-hydrolysing)
LSDWLFTPSPDATENLVREGVDRNRIHWVGNVMADSLLGTLEKLDIDTRLSGYAVDRGDFGLLTLHRPSNVDDVSTLVRLVGAVAEISQQVPILFPVHPRTSPQLLVPEVQRVLRRAPRIRLLPPIGYQDCVALQAGAALVLTDSGGLQEETTILGVPCLTLRETTERPITVTQGTNTVVGTDPETITAAAEQALTMRDVPRAAPVGWDGHAAERVVTALLSVPAPLNAQRQQPVARSVVLDEARVA